MGVVCGLARSPYHRLDALCHCDQGGRECQRWQRLKHSRLGWLKAARLCVCVGVCCSAAEWRVRRREGAARRRVGSRVERVRFPCVLKLRFSLFGGVSVSHRRRAVVGVCCRLFVAHWRERAAYALAARRRAPDAAFAVRCCCVTAAGVVYSSQRYGGIAPLPTTAKRMRPRSESTLATQPAVLRVCVAVAACSTACPA